MRGKNPILVYILFLLSLICFPQMSLSSEQSQPTLFNFTSSTHYLWGDDVLGDKQNIVAQYLRFKYETESKKFSAYGYARGWKNFGDTKIEETDKFLGRLYYLFIDYTPNENFSTRIGRQFSAYTAGKSLMDGVRIDAKGLGIFGLSASVGRDIIFTRDSEYTKMGNVFYAASLYLDRVKELYAGISYAVLTDNNLKAREEVGLNARTFYKFISPYTEMKYDRVSQRLNDVLWGVDIFPIDHLYIKTEYYYMYPTFGSTSIYSVFAAEKYQDYRIKVEYSFDKPIVVFTGFAHERYGTDESANVYTIGARFYPTEKLAMSVTLDDRKGYDGNILGIEVTADYKMSSTIVFAGGVQRDTYKRPMLYSYNDANRYWAACQWSITKRSALTARFEDNINENFRHRMLGRIEYTWNFE